MVYILLAKYTHPSSQDHRVLSHYDISLKSRILSFKSGPRVVEARLLWCDSLGTIPLYLYCELKRQVSCPHLPTYIISKQARIHVTYLHIQNEGVEKRHTEFLAVIKSSYACAATPFIRAQSCCLQIIYSCS